ncbi:MAG: dienelactone hydrolase family protein [Gammaproteobacteria bacterium]
MTVLPVKGFGQTLKKEKITYLSRNIFGFENMFGDVRLGQPEQEIFGYLQFPDNFDPDFTYPLVIASHGSANWREHHSRYLDQMRATGFAVFSIHPFDSRNIESTVGNQINLTAESVIWDMAMALKALWNDSRIDNKRIFAAGWSLGGTAVLFNAWIPFQQEAFRAGENFSGYLMWYPACLALPDTDDWDKDFVQIYMGEADNWTPAKPCVELVARMNSMGGSASIEIYPGAYHSFDSTLPLTLQPDAYSWTKCDSFKLSAETKKVYDPDNKELNFSDPQLRRLAYESCAIKGEVMAGSNPEHQNAPYEHLSNLLSEKTSSD